MKRTLLLTTALLAFAAMLPAAVIDFTQATYSTLSGQPTATFNAAGYEITLTAELSSGIPNWALPFLEATLSHEEGSGIGINTTVLQSFNALDPEIESFERLRVAANPSLSIFGFTLSNLYREGWLFPYNEKAQYRINEGEWQTASGDSGGSIYVPLGDPMTGVLTLDFRAKPGSLFQQNDFALASLNVAAVPEPGTFALLGGGLLLAGVFYRRRRA